MSHEKFLTEAIQDLRKNELLFDYTLVADGESIPVHKVVMAACSDYFRVMFTGGMKESRENQVELKEISASTLKTLVEFAYTGELELNMENVGEIISYARYFQMTQATQECEKFLQSKVFLGDFEDNVEIFNMAIEYSLPVEEEMAETNISSNFWCISDETFLELPEDKLLNILARGDFCVLSEYKLFQQVLSWIQAGPDIGEDRIFALISKVRFPLMSEKEISEVAKVDVMSKPRCQELLFEAQEYHKDVLKQPLLQSENTQVRAFGDSIILALKNHFFKIDPESHDVGIVTSDVSLEKEMFCNQKMVSVDNFLYVCGTSESSDFRFRDSDCFYRYDPRFDTWLKLSSMNGKRNSFELVPYYHDYGFIYAFGGTTEIVVECYSIKDNKWEAKAPMDTPRYGLAGVEYEGKIYLSGGITSEKAPTKFLDCYSPSEDTWESKAPMPQEQKYHLMTRVSDKLYVFGGEWRDNVDYYSPSVDQWTSCFQISVRHTVNIFVNVHDEVFLLGVKEDNFLGSERHYQIFCLDPISGDVSLRQHCHGDPEKEVGINCLSQLLDIVDSATLPLLW